MNSTELSRRSFVLGAAAAALVPASLFAQEPVRQLTMVVGFPPGVPTRPGWGCEVNEEAVRAHPPKQPR